MAGKSPAGRVFGRPGNSADLLSGNTDRLGRDIDVIETDARNVLEAGGGIDAGLVEGAVNEAEFHGEGT